jgi:hypothetical protein
VSAADQSAVAVMAPAAGDPVAAMKAMRSARRRRYVRRADVMEVLYRVYLAAIAGLFVLAFLAGALHEVPADPASVAGIRDHGPALIGVVVALLVYAGLRSGARGGPLAIEGAEVRYTLLAPVSRRRALRPAALAQLRVAVPAGAVLGGVVGNFVFRRFPGGGAEWIGSLAAFGALVPIAVLGAAMVGSGRRLRPPVAAALGLALVAWTAVDLAAGSNTSPATMLGDLATLPLQHGANASLAAFGAVIALVLLAAGLLGIGGLALEAAQRRAQLVAEMRFSASVQDLRTVILLRRQLASERPRRKPWLRLPGAVVGSPSAGAPRTASPRPGGARPPGAASDPVPPPRPAAGAAPAGSASPRPGAAHPLWRRDAQSFLRWPAVRIGRVVLIAVAAGAIAVGGFDLTPVLFVLPGPLLFIAALDLIEPFAQESDHPTRRLLLPRRSADLFRDHLVAPAIATGIVLAIATVAAAAIGGDPGLALGIGGICVVPGALVLVLAAAVNATNDPYEFVLMAPEMTQAVNFAPLVCAMLAFFVPLFVGWKVEGGDGARIGGALVSVPVSLTLAMVGYAVLGWRADKREAGAM